MGGVIEARLIHSWIAKGLLDQPRVRTLRRGSQKAEHSVNQRRLLLLLLDKRRQIAHLNALAQVPLAVWLWWDDYVPTRQARRAWTTWVGRGRRSQEVTNEGAAGLLQQVGHQLATPTARARFVRIVTELGNGKPLTVRGRAELLDAVRDVMEPDTVFAASGLVRARARADADDRRGGRDARRGPVRSAALHRGRDGGRHTAGAGTGRPPGFHGRLPRAAR
ncbi:hypothetical protein ACWGDT_30915 [Streptomyces avermitilis]